VSLKAPRFHRWLLGVLAAATLVVIALPAALGPTWGPILRALGEQTTHVCKCGMKAGTCGCPECARLEHEREDAKRACPVPAVRRACDDEGPAFAFGDMPLAVVPVIARVPVTPSLGAALRPDEMTVLRGVEAKPPTPPPRIALA
jgi:hypothetical protein